MSRARTAFAVLAAVLATSMASTARAQLAASPSFQLDGAELGAAADAACSPAFAAFGSARGPAQGMLASASFGAEVGFLGVHDPTAGSAPLVFGVTPPLGTMDGGTAVTVCGMHFFDQGAAGPVTVQVAGNPASVPTVLSDTQVSAVTPATPPGPNAVAVTTLQGAASEPDAFLSTPAVQLPPSIVSGVGFELRNYGAVGGFFDVYASPTATSIPVPPYGTLLIGPAPIVNVFAGVPYPAPGAVHVQPVTLNVMPALIGASLHVQTLAILSIVPLDVRLTNRSTAVFR